MSKIIECQVNDEYILGSGVVIGAAGSHDDVYLRLIFNEMWDGLNIVATFKDALAESETVIPLMSSMLEEGDTRTYLIGIPGGAKKYAGRAKLTLSGYSVYAVEENGTRIYKKDSLTNTATAFFRVLESDAAIVKDDEDSEPTYKEIVQVELNTFYERMTGLESEMDEWEKNLGDAEDAREVAESLRAEAESDRKEYYDNLDLCLDKLIELQDKMIAAGNNASSVLTSVLDAYPVGAIYISLTATSPSQLFGGSWVAIEEGRFLLAAGTSYVASESGGSENHKHDAGELYAQIATNVYNSDKQSVVPNTFIKAREVLISQYEANAVVRSASANVTNLTNHGSSIINASYGTAVGGETAEVNNMPPYYAVYMWQRIEYGG